MNVIIGNAWPYANGPLHLGRIAVLLPGDILARYHRLMGDEVVFISGTDCHGTPVKMKAKEEGVTPDEVIEKYHNMFQRCFQDLGFSFDLFSKTHKDYHQKKVKEFILDLIDKGYIYEKEIEQTYCSECCEFLNDRYIEGICPHCGGYADGDQCGTCAGIYESSELVNRRCKICKSEPVTKKTKHLFFKLSKFENDVKRLFIRQQGWRENAEKIVKRYLDEGLRDRAVTRDFDWGVDVPIEGYSDKKIYVWIEAVMGYLTASMEILESRDEDWNEYWQGDDSRIYFVHGKDNIPFHTVIFPAILAGLGIKNPNLRIVSSEYLKLEGKNFSAVKNYAIWIDDIVKKYNTDAVRYYLVLNSPENKDMDFTWKSFVNTNNNDLVNSLNYFISRVLESVEKDFNGEIPNGKINSKVKDDILNLYFNVGDMIEDGKFKESLTQIMNFVRRSNKYLDNVNKSSKEYRKNAIYESIQIIANLSNLLEPYMPFVCEEIRTALNFNNNIWSYIEIKSGKITSKNNFFERIDKKVVHEELLLLKEKKY